MSDDNYTWSDIKALLIECGFFERSKGTLQCGKIDVKNIAGGIRIVFYSEENEVHLICNEIIVL